jgi:hypothetical protein
MSNRGGYLVFGVSNQPRLLVGLTSKNFETLDEAIVTAYLNGLFSPEIQYEKFVIDVRGKQVGLLYVHKSMEGAIIGIKNDGDVKEGEIYYRYNARSEKIKYPELKAVLEQVKETERKAWMNLFERVSKIGPADAGILNMVEGTIDGSGNSLLIDHKLLPKLKFIKEGQFSERGKPTLKLIGDVRPVMVNANSGVPSVLQLTTDPTAPAVREETILKDYPLSYLKLIDILSKRYSNFKLDREFYALKRKFMADPKYSRPRYLDPSNPNSSKKDFYSLNIVFQFDKHYTKKGVT